MLELGTGKQISEKREKNELFVWICRNNNEEKRKKKLVRRKEKWKIKEAFKKTIWKNEKKENEERNEIKEGILQINFIGTWTSG